MKRKNRLFFIALCGLFVFTFQLHLFGQQNVKNRSQLTTAKSSSAQTTYAVGFKTYYKSDYSRPSKPKRDYEGSSLSDVEPTNLQISIWYPAQKSVRTAPLKFSEYLYLSQQPEKAKVLTDADKKQSADSLKGMFKFGAGRDLSDADIQTIVDKPTQAYLNAAPAAGKFPVIISGFGAPSNCSAFGELLASHGYIVITIPSNRIFGTLQATKPQLALEGHMRNIEFALSEAHQIPNADFSRLGVVGVNFDGMAAVLFQMRNMVADAVVSIDGWEGKQNSIQTVKNSIYYNPLKMRVPYLLFLQDEPTAPNSGLTLNYDIFDALKYAERSAFVVNGINHFYYVGNPAGAGAIPPDKQAGINFIQQTLLGFLDKYVKKSSSTTAQITNQPNLLKTEKQVRAFKALPFAVEFERIIMEEQDIEKATRIFREARRENPEVVLFEENTMNLFAFRFQRQNKPETALAILNLNAEAYPKSASAINQLAITLMALNRHDEAIKTFQRGIDAGLPKGQTFFNMACAYVGLKQNDLAFEFLNKAIDEGYKDRSSFETDTDLTPLRSDARFQQLLTRLNAAKL